MRFLQRLMRGQQSDEDDLNAMKMICHKRLQQNMEKKMIK